MSESVAAETVGLKALSFIAAEPEALGRLLATSGMDAAALRGRAEDPHVLAGVLEFLLREEALLIAFCETENFDARGVHLAAMRLSG